MLAIIKEAAELFYPNGESLHYGTASSMQLELGNFKGEVVKGESQKEMEILALFHYLMSKLDNEFMELNNDSSETDKKLISNFMFPKDAVDPSLSTPEEKSILFVCENSVQEAVKNESITKTDYNKRIQSERASPVVLEPDL